MSSTPHAALPATDAPVDRITDQCPWCEQPIPHDRFDEILARIRDKEQARAAAQAKQLRAEFDRKMTAKAASAKAQIEEVERKSAAALERTKSEAAKRQATACAEVRKEVGNTLGAQVRVAERAKQAVEKKIEALKTKQESDFTARLQKELQAQREALEKDKVEAVHAEQATALRDRQQFQKQIDLLSRRLDKKTPADLGNGAEVDLFDALRAKFRSDAIKRIDQGVAGADIWHEVVHEGDTCGRVIYDAKNRRAWRNSYVDKLRNDQLAAKADHAVLATKAFGQGKQQLHTQNGVIVAHPARVVEIVAILRAGLIRARRLGLSREETTEKTAALYEFVNSERCSQLFEHFEEVTKELLEIDVAEKNAHEATWEQRGERIRKTERLILGILRAEMNQILQEGPGRE